MRALDLGAMGFIPKTQTSGVMIGALKVVLSGGVYLPADVMSQAAAPTATATNETEGVYDPKAQGAELGLTPRQAEVLSLLIQGKPNKVICRDLNLAEGTVKIHVAAILKALGVMNRTQAVVAVSRMGLKLGPLRPRPNAQPPGPPGSGPSPARTARP